MSQGRPSGVSFFPKGPLMSSSYALSQPAGETFLARAPKFVPPLIYVRAQGINQPIAFRNLTVKIQLQTL